jgi:hypothetical protein
MQDWIVETVLLSPLDFSLRLMPSENALLGSVPRVSTHWPCRRTASSEMRQVSPSKLTGASSVDEKAPDARYGHHEDLLPAWESFGDNL